MNIIVAVCKNGGIGLKNNLPWKLKSEMKYFKYITQGTGNNAVIMGKNTWFSLNNSLPKRDNIIISNSLYEKKNMIEIPKKMILESKIINNDKCLLSLSQKYDDVWIIGGEILYKSMINNNLLKTIYYTDIDANINCDTFFPEIPNHFNKVFTSKDYEENGIKYNMNIFVNNNYFGDSGYSKYINNAKAALHYTDFTL